MALADSAAHNSGMFDAIQRETDLGPRALLSATDASEGKPMPEIRVIGHGHDHLTSFCARHKAVWSCFAGGSSYSGYGLPSFDRRVRVYNVQDFGETIRTYQIVDGSAVGELSEDVLKWNAADNKAFEAEEAFEDEIEKDLEDELYPGSEHRPEEEAVEKEADDGQDHSPEADLEQAVAEQDEPSRSEEDDYALADVVADAEITKRQADDRPPSRPTKAKPRLKTIGLLTLVGPGAPGSTLDA